MEKTENDIQIREFTDFIRAVGSEIEQAQVRLISAANVQMLMHYWKLGHFILFAQKQLGWGGKVIEKISKAIRDKYPEKKGYSPRNLKYMCQFAKIYPLDILKQMLFADEELQTLSVEKVLVLTKSLNEYEVCRHEIIPFIARNEIGQQPAAQIQNTDLKRNIFGQEPLAQIHDVSKSLPQITQQPVAQIQNVDLESNIFAQEPPAQIHDVSKTLTLITQEPLAQIEQIFTNSPIAKINWASHMVLMDKKLPLGLRYWYMKEALEFGWSSNIMAIQIETDLFKRQIASRKITNFTATIPQPQSDLANYLLKDPYIFDLTNAKKSADERDSDYQLSNAIPEDLKSTLPSIEEVEHELTQLLERNKK